VRQVVCGEQTKAERQSAFEIQTRSNAKPRNLQEARRLRRQEEKAVMLINQGKEQQAKLAYRFPSGIRLN